MTNERLPEPDEIAALPDMAALRAAIDALDRRMIGLLARRSLMIDRAVQIKRRAGLPARIDARVEEVVANARAEAAAAGLDPALAEALWRRIVDWSIAREERALEEVRP